MQCVDLLTLNMPARTAYSAAPNAMTLASVECWGLKAKRARRVRSVTPWRRLKGWGRPRGQGVGRDTVVQAGAGLGCV